LKAQFGYRLFEAWDGTLGCEILGRVIVALTAIVILSAAGFAQSGKGPDHDLGNRFAFDATHLTSPVDLGSTWLIHAGDDPAYARPDFDDSGWSPFDPHASLIPFFSKVHPEIVWYRQRIRVSPSQTGLALRERSISRAFEAYVNGERLISSGKIAPYSPYTVGGRVLRRIPDRLMASGSLLIALRVHISASEWAVGQDPGYFATNLTLGQEQTLYKDNWLAALGENLLDGLDRGLLFSLGIVAIVLFAAQRHQVEYLCIFALGLISLAQFLYGAITQFREIPAGWEFAVVSLRIASPILWGTMYFAFVHLKVGWRFRIYLVFAGLLNAYNGLQGLLGSQPGAWQLLINLPFVTLLSIVIPIVLIIHLRRGNREAGILLIPSILFSLYIYAEYTLAVLFQIPAWRDTALRGFNVINNYPAGPFAISLDNLSGILCSAALAIIMLLRATSMSRRQALLEGELAAAQQVQQLLLPEQVGTMPGFTIESVYQPAQQVGGDFFQILSKADNELLLIVGDVAGKGLPAAMLVSVLVGAVRTVTDYTHAPDEILSNLNERLMGRANGGFSTALAAHISAAGIVTIANAGHLSPYLDGQEIELPGALPLGIVSPASYETIRFQLSPGSRLTFYSDGVVEAQNKQGDLFGFDRGQAISTESAVTIAEAAIRFGQSDDITVVAIARAASIATAA
jgi:phosphoserine phosphatase RsbU/P